jgi:hypothetical protein
MKLCSEKLSLSKTGVEGPAGTKADAAQYQPIESRLLQLWRDGKLAWKGERLREWLKYDLDSPENVVRAWKQGLLKLAD